MFLIPAKASNPRIKIALIESYEASDTYDMDRIDTQSGEELEGFLILFNGNFVELDEVPGASLYWIYDSEDARDQVLANVDKVMANSDPQNGMVRNVIC